MTISERIKALRELKNLNKAQLGRMIGVSGAAVGQYEAGTSHPKPQVLLKLNKVLGFDFINDRPITESNTFQKPSINEDRRGVPYYDVDFIGGYDLLINDQTVNPLYYIDFFPYNDADCWLNVTGKSMGPLIAHGDIVALKEVQGWQEFLLEGEIYAIVTKNGFRTIKIIGPGPDSDHYMLEPYNKEYKPQPIPKKIITRIFRVKGALKKFF